jgi:hypothetical protein
MSENKPFGFDNLDEMGENEFVSVEKIKYNEQTRRLFVNNSVD